MLVAKTFVPAGATAFETFTFEQKNSLLDIEYYNLFGLRFYISVNSYDNVETVISPNHTFFLGKLD